jgi:hypothetical protein
MSSDDTRNPGRPDRDRINLEQDYEVRDWTRSLGVTENELRKAVQAVGNTASKVREYLHKEGTRLGFHKSSNMCALRRDRTHH